MIATSSPRIAVIGGGITGLSAAHRLLERADQSDQPLEVTLFEASDRLGGVFGTQTMDGYMVETGADSFITSKPWGVDLCHRLGLADQLIGTNDEFRRSLILHDGRPVPTPDGFELILPRNLRALLASPLLSVEGKLRAASEAFVPPRTDPADESLADFVRRRFGPELLDRIAQPMVGGIYTSDPELLSMQATLPRFVEMERQHGSLLRAVWHQRRNVNHEPSPDNIASGARYGLFVTLKTGMATLPSALEQRIRSHSTIHLRSQVTVLGQLDDGRFSLETSGVPRQTFDGVIVAIPALAAADLLVPWDTALADQLRAIQSASSAIVVTGHRLKDIAHPLDAFGLVIPHREGRRILAVSFLSRKYPNRAPAGHVQLRTFVGGAMQPELLAQDDELLIRMVRDELQDLLGVSGVPTMAVVARYHQAMPQYHVGHTARVAAIETAAAKHARLALAGNAYHGVGLPDCIHSGERAADEIFSRVTA